MCDRDEIFNEDARQREEVIAGFEEAWLHGEQPAIDDFLVGEGRSRKEILVELVHADLECRLKTDESVRVEDYLSRYPELKQNTSTVVELIAWEYNLRQRSTSSIDPREFFRRFPELRDSLRAVLEVRSEGEDVSGQSPVRVNCPHCRNPIEILDNGSTEDTLCPACGSTFRLSRDRTLTWSPDKLPHLGTFKLLEPVGRGACATVYRAHDSQLDRVVAVKVPRSGTLLSDEDEDRFLREARSAAQLCHECIVPVYEVGRSHTFPYIVSEFVDGITLSDALTGRQFSFRQAAELIAQVAEAVASAHEQGVIHRDLKPSNIMIEQIDGGIGEPGGESRQTPAAKSSFKPRVMDFGLALRDRGEASVTLDGQILGTPAYMSPEQARGDSHRVDGRTDVYSLGVIFYELLAGELPFRGNVRMLLHQVLHDEPRSLRRLNDRIPRDLETITLKAMAKEPSRRYQSAAELAGDLRRWLSDRPITARPVSRIEKAWRWCRRNRTLAQLAATVLLLLFSLSLLGPLAAWYQARLRHEVDEQRDRAVHEAREANRQREAAEASKELAQQESEAARRQVYISDLRLIQWEWACNNIEAILDILGKHEDEHDLRGFEWDYWWRQCHSELFKFQFNEHVRPVAISPNGGWLATGADDDKIRLWNTNTWRDPLLFDGYCVHSSCLAFSPDSSMLATCCDMDVFDDCDCVKVWDIASGRLMLVPERSDLGGVAISPDGRLLAHTAYTFLEKQFVRLSDTTTGRKVRSFQAPSGSVCTLAFSPDGKWLAVRYADVDNGEALLLIRDTTAGEPVLNIAVGECSGDAFYETGSMLSPQVAFSPDSRRLASYAVNNTVKLWRIPSGEESFSVKGGSKGQVAFNRDGSLIAVDGPHNLAMVYNAATGKRVAALAGHTDQVTFVAFHCDGRRVVTGSHDDTVRYWDATREHEYLAFDGHHDAITSLAFSPDGRTLVSGSSSGNVNLSDVLTGEVKRTLNTREKLRFGLEVNPCISFVSDGRLLVASRCGNVVTWNTATGQDAHVLNVDGMAISKTALSPDAERLAAGTWNSVKVLNVHTGQELLTLEGHSRPVICVTYSPDGDLLASGDGPTAPAGYDSFAFSLPGIDERSGAVKLWNAANGQLQATLEGHTDSVIDVGFSSDGQRIATAGMDRTVRLWDVATGKSLRILNGHTRTVTSVAFEPDGRRLASGSEDGTVKVWDVASGQELLTLGRHLAGQGVIYGESRIPITSVAFSPDGKQLAGGTADGQVMLWDARPDSLQLTIERRAASLVRFLFQQDRTKSEAADKVSADNTIDEDVKQEALRQLRAFPDS